MYLSVWERKKKNEKKEEEISQQSFPFTSKLR
jgi:hypothetical protein